MKKPGIEINGEALDQLVAVRENLYIITGRLGGSITNTKQLASSSVGIDVATGAGTMVATTAELSQLILRVADIERVLRALVIRLNTP